MPEYETWLLFDKEACGDLRIVAELVAVLG